MTGRRSTWSGHITFGMTSIPVKLYTVVSEDKSDLHQYHAPCGSRITAPRHCATCGTNVEGDTVRKGVDCGGGKVVTFSSMEERNKLMPLNMKHITVQRFVWADDIDPKYLGTPYYVMADGYDGPFVALRAAMADLGRVAIGRVVLRTRESFVVLRAVEGGLVAHQLVWPELVRAPEWRSLSTANEPAVKNAIKVIEDMTSVFTPSDYVDEYKVRLNKLIEEKSS